jgi:RIO kinase 1
VSFDFSSHDEFDELVTRFQLLSADERHLQQVQRVDPRRKKTRRQTIQELAEQTASLEDDFRITYQPARFEAQWLLQSLRPLYARDLIEDVLALVKGGKEANVYLCRGPQATGSRLLAAKVYRPQQLRNLRNDKMYREGRELLNHLGVPVKNRNNREMRAIQKKTAFGAELVHVSWLMHEFLTLQRLHTAGAAVPEPIAAADNTILMAYVGAAGQPAPVLHGVRLPERETAALFDEVLRNVELMLRMGMVHGDLSAFNILYWRGQVTLIDFPQVTFAESNHNAYRIFRRDVQRVCEYFAAQGLRRPAQAIADRLWNDIVGLPPDRTVQDG